MVEVTTTTFSGKVVKKPFSFSYSKLKNYATCPRRYKAIDVDKTIKEEKGPALDWGNRVHEEFAKRIMENKPFSSDMPEEFEAMAQRLLKMDGSKHAELKLAIKRDLSPCEWFDKNTYYRGIADFLGINAPVALAVDYKTGKIIEDSDQLALMAECIFSHYPQVQAVRTEFWWVKEDAITRADFKRSDRQGTWAKVLPKANQLEEAHAKNEFPPKESGLCRKFCPVTWCEYNGRNK